jgi:FdhE protein
VRQGESTTEGKWIGNPSGGVKAPEPIILPDPSKRFIRTASRLVELAAGHPMEPWLLFMAKLSEAQHIAATRLAPFASPDKQMVDQAVAARMPPFAADGHRRNPAWREGLAILLDNFDSDSVPPEAKAIMVDVRHRKADALEALAENFLQGSISTAETGATLYVTAALQVYFTRLAASLQVSSLRLLEQRGLCPCCGSTPVSGIITASGDTPGTRYLYCSLCSTAWNHVRIICITCGEGSKLSLQTIEGGSEAIKAETCGECHTYSKMLYQGQDPRVDPYADDLASLGLDVLVSEAGFARHAPNPLLLIG